MPVCSEAETAAGIGNQSDRASTTRWSPRLMWVTRNKLTGSASSMPAPNQVRCFAPTMAAIAGWTSSDCARSLLLTPGVSPHAPRRIMFGGIEADVSVADRVFVAIEAGALVCTFDGGRIWRDRVRGGPYDTHTAMTHPFAPGRIYSAAGDGYYESTDAGDSWRLPEDGLKHLYLVGVAVDPADPDTVIVSATDGPAPPIRREGPRRTCTGRLGFRDGNSQ